jgi:hypothetical protein
MSVMPYATVVGVFRKRAAADLAIEALTKVGFKREQMRYLTAGTGAGFLNTVKSVFTGISPEEEKLVSNLTDMGLSAEEAQYFSDEYTQGSAILAIQTQGDEEMAMNILAQYGAHNARKGTNLHGWSASASPQAPAAEADNYTAPVQDPSNYAVPAYSAPAQNQDELEPSLTAEDHSTQDHQQEEATANATFEIHYQPMQPASPGLNPDAYGETTFRDQTPSPATEIDDHAQPFPQENASNPDAPFPHEAASNPDTPFSHEVANDPGAPFPHEVTDDPSTPFPHEVVSDPSSPFPQEAAETPIVWANEENTVEMEGMDDMDEARTLGYNDEQSSPVGPGVVEMVEVEESAMPASQIEPDASPQISEASPVQTNELEQLLAQVEATRQQLQAVRVQLDAAKEHESKLTTARLQLKELQAELQATQAELQETQQRMAN